MTAPHRLAQGRRHADRHGRTPQPVDRRARSADPRRRAGSGGALSSACATTTSPAASSAAPSAAAGDGLRLFPGAIGDGRDAGRFELGSRSLAARPRRRWSAPSSCGRRSTAPAIGRSPPPPGLAVLGRFAVVIHADRIPAGPLIVTGWPIASEGRKHRAGTALHDRDGRLLAAAEATWITLK